MIQAADLRLAEVPEILPRRRGKLVTTATLKRWVMRGCRGVRLEAWFVGNELFTSHDALQRFSDALARKAGIVRIVPQSEISGRAKSARRSLGWQ